MSNKDRKYIGVHITEDQWKLCKRRMFVDGLSWKKLLNAAINAYIMGDLTIDDKTGRYSVHPPPDSPPVVTVSDSHDGEIELDPDLQIRDRSPYLRGHRTRSVWGTRELRKYLQDTTGRSISLELLRTLLREMFDKEPNDRWRFEGPKDERVKELLQLIEDGAYDVIRRESMSRIKEFVARREHEQQQIKDAVRKDKQYRKDKAREMKASIERDDD